MSSTYIIAKYTIEKHKKSRKYCENMIDLYLAAGHISDEEYMDLVALINTVYGE